MKNLMLLCLVLSFFMSGCFIEKEMVPTPKKIVSNPLGTNKVKVGMEKEEILYIWGDPSQITFEKIEGVGEREVWLYSRRSDMIPVGGTYFRGDQYLYFDGKNLTKITNERMKAVVEEVDQ